MSFHAIATPRRPEDAVRHESRMIAREVAADALLAESAIDRMRFAIERLEREWQAFDHYVNNIAGRAPQ